MGCIVFTMPGNFPVPLYHHCFFGVLTGEDEHTAFYSAILESPKATLEAEYVTMSLCGLRTLLLTACVP